MNAHCEKLTNFFHMIESVTSNKREMNTLLKVKTQEKSFIHIYTYSEYSMQSSIVKTEKLYKLNH